MIKNKKTKAKLSARSFSSNYKNKKTKETKAKLLAPAGDFTSLRAAVNAGADAVYFGLQEGMNMRARAKNFNLGDLSEIKKITGKKVKRYLALNAIIYDNELAKIERILKKARRDVDAVICWDPAVIELCRKYKVDFHISTQASVSNTESAKFYKKLGAKSVNLARELSLEQIKKIAKIMPVEVFIHGAMCVSISGRCFTSQFLFGKSANRGECLQPCRREYTVRDDEGNEVKLENKTVMSAKDLCALPFIEKLKQAGVTRFKIEGRNREPEYVDTVVRNYRKALDKKLSPKEIEEGLRELNRVYTKGFSSGFFLGTPTRDDFSSVESSSAEQSKKFIGRVENYLNKIKVAIIKIHAGKICVGDELFVLGKNTGVIRHKVSRMEMNHKPVASAIKSQVVGIKIPGAKKGNDVYLIVKNKKRI